MAKQSKKYAVDWSLRNLDTNAPFLPQFPIEGGVRLDVGAGIASQDRFGFQDPIIQWTKGKALTVSFRTMLFSRAGFEDIQYALDGLVALSQKDETMGRSPICLFTYGKYLSLMVLVESADTTIESLKTSDGTPRHATVSITLKKYVPFSQESFDPSKKAKESFYLVARASMKTYEEIARQFYGDAMYGDRLRKRNPEYPMFPELGTIIKVPSRAVVMKEVVEPSCHVFDRTDEDAMTAFATILDDRNDRKVIFVR